MITYDWFSLNIYENSRENYAVDISKKLNNRRFTINHIATLMTQYDHNRNR